ncbi:MAG: CsbD family protein [Acidobacteriota bacterium]
MRYEEEIEGKGKQVKGTVKEKLGKLTGHEDLQEQGNQERAEGKIQENLGKARRKIGEAVEDLGDRIAG